MTLCRAWAKNSQRSTKAPASILIIGGPLLGYLLLASASPAFALSAAALVMLAGAFVERWLFFAQARHMVTLYY